MVVKNGCGIEALESMNGFMKKIMAFALALLPASSLFAEVNLSGGWGFRFHEDYNDRWPGPRSGDYLGLSLNAAARMKADSWSASLISLPERQCIPHPADYGTRGPANMVWWSEVNPDSQQVVAWKFRVSWMGTERTIWMDGRPHPPEYAQHTRQGFSTGKWEGDTLVVTTSHLKMGYLRRNGVPRSDKATLREHWMSNGPHLTLATIVYDPVYLEAPQIFTSNFVQDTGFNRTPAFCNAAIEVVRGKGEIPAYFPWANPDLNELAVETGLPIEAVRGGVATTFPEYLIQLGGALSSGVDQRQRNER